MTFYEPMAYGVPESYSRELDQQVWRQEMPYGYEGDPPMAGHENEASQVEFNKSKNKRDL